MEQHKYFLQCLQRLRRHLLRCIKFLYVFSILRVEFINNIIGSFRISFLKVVRYFN